jgi:hypothetical protein
MRRHTIRHGFLAVAPDLRSRHLAIARSVVTRKRNVHPNYQDPGFKHHEIPFVAVACRLKWCEAGPDIELRKRSGFCLLI